MSIKIVFCNYTVVIVPKQYDADLRLPKTDIKYRRALKSIKKHKMERMVLTIDTETNKPYRNPNKDGLVKRQTGRYLDPKLKKKDQVLYIRDIDVIYEIGSPTKQAL